MLRDDIVVYALTSNKELVNEVCDYLNIKPGLIDVKHFADGEIIVETKSSVRGKHVFIVQSTCKPVSEKLMELLIAIDSIKRASAKEITIITPYFGYARQDRKARARQPISARLVADLLTVAGIDRIITIDLHAQQIQGFFNIPTDDLSAISLFAKHINDKGYFKHPDVVVVSPDHGGVTRARSLASAIGANLAIIDKRRPRPNEVQVSNIIGDIKDKICMICDDICDTAGSLVASAKLLAENGAKEIYVFVTHGIFSNDALEKIEASPIKKMLITNTIPFGDKMKQRTSKVEVLSISKMISKMIEAVSNNESVAQIFDYYSTESNKGILKNKKY